MTTFVKKFFCRHVYKGFDIETLYWKRERNGGIGWGNLPTYSDYVYFARTEQCLKCDKERIVVGKQNIGHQIPENLDQHE